MTTRRCTRPALLALAAATACAGSQGSRYQDPQMDFGAIKTIAILPFTNLSRDSLGAERVRDVYANQLLATGAVYVVPYGEVIRGIGKAGIATPQTPNTEEVVRLGTALKAEAVITGVVKEYGEVRSGSASANVVSMSVQLVETATGKVVWSGDTTRGGVTFTDRLFGGGGAPLNDVTEAAVHDLIRKMLR